MRNIDNDLLRTFVAIAEQHSMLAAATQVRRSQAAVTQQMQRLAEQLGRPLFERSGRGVQLTPDGQKLLVYARRMLTLHDEMVSALSGLSPTGQIRLGAPHDVTESILPVLLTQMAQRYPHLQIAIHTGRSPDLLKDLRKGELDLSIAIALDETDLRSVLLRTSPIVWLAASTFRHEPREPLPLIVAEDWTYFRRVAIQALDRAEIPWRIHYTAPNVVGIRAAVRAGLGVMARSIEMLGPDLRVLGNAEKLPQLPDVGFRLYLGPRSVNPLARQIFDSIEQRGG
ncbi:LysR substrate-binding domain-containing protein [Hydrogenophaga sp.]|uniref:LysR substrate-binding domain-containing protein n=1 Tax=Hydrogenophaga sp. TaxID=1904254 RepID=UPI00271E43DC|nr:LysR substrate-binding domain-containing protein [Hydrogenophaga sp.]MDO9436799.1 LysR substrate-binding domain-containing protein [Hydrogenophaga sp.]